MVSVEVAWSSQMIKNIKQLRGPRSLRSSRWCLMDILEQFLAVDIRWYERMQQRCLWMPMMPWHEEIGLALPGLPVLLGDVETDSRGMNIVCWRPGMMGEVHWLTCIVSIAAISTGSYMYITVYFAPWCPVLHEEYQNQFRNEEITQRSPEAHLRNITRLVLCHFSSY